MKKLTIVSFILSCCVTVLGQGPTCDVATQNPDSSVSPLDVGTVITLTLVTTDAVAATIDGVPMTAVIGTPGVDPVITWEATHVAVADVVITAVVTDSIGQTTSAGCSWTIDINCIDPNIVSVAPVGAVGVTISGTPGCNYTVRITEHNIGSITDYDVLVDFNGLGVLNIVIPPDAWIEVGQQGLPTPTGSAMTVPTLGQWGLITFVLMFMAWGIINIRRNRLT